MRRGFRIDIPKCKANVIFIKYISRNLPAMIFEKLLSSKLSENLGRKFRKPQKCSNRTANPVARHSTTSQCSSLQVPTPLSNFHPKRGAVRLTDQGPRPNQYTSKLSTSNGNHGISPRHRSNFFECSIENSRRIFKRRLFSDAMTKFARCCDLQCVITSICVRNCISKTVGP